MKGTVSGHQGTNFVVAFLYHFMPAKEVLYSAPVGKNREARTNGGNVPELKYERTNDVSLQRPDIDIKVLDLLYISHF